MNKIGREVFFILVLLCSVLILVSYSLRETPTSKITSESVVGSIQGNVQFSIIAEGPYCGDSLCNNGETCLTCVADCGCDSGYTCTSGSCIADSVPSTSESSSSSGGGGGSVVVADSSDFYIDKTSLKLVLQKGNTYSKQLVLINNGTRDLSIEVLSTNPGKFINLAENSFILKRGEKRPFVFKIYVSENQETDVYLERIEFKSGDLKRFVNLVLDVQDPKALFDLRTKIVNKYLLPGKIVHADISILNLGNLNNLDANLEYAVKDFNNNTYSSENIRITLGDYFKKRVSLPLPDNLELGEYVFYTKLKYDKFSVSSYDTFFIEKLSFAIWIVIITSIMIFVIILIVLAVKEKKSESEKNSPNN